MAKNMTISIPDELHQSIQEVREGFKPSAICQDALWKAVKIAQAIQNENVCALQEKFRQERKGLFQAYYDEGFEDGRKDAFKFDYARAEGFFEFIDEPETFGYYASESSQDKFISFQSGNLPHEIGHYDKQKWAADYAAAMYEDGWEDGVKLVLKKALSGKEKRS